MEDALAALDGRRPDGELAAWVKARVRDFNAGTLDAATTAALLDANVHLGSSPAAVAAAMEHALAAFRRTHGTRPVPQHGRHCGLKGCTARHGKLGRWWAGRRAAHDAGELGAEEKARLQGIFGAAAFNPVKMKRLSARQQRKLRNRAAKKAAAVPGE